MTADGVGLAFSKDHIKAAPELDMTKELDDQQESQLLGHYGLTHPGASSGWPSSGGGDAMTRSEEELEVGKVRREAGRVRLRKYVVTENVATTVPVEREEVRVEREPITPANADDATAGPEI
ncbi:MAG: YsnF/AvaK domain-containing protein, partial [Actinomycetota bacterium]|nr:YsnF/AvaK domain-containing protein [Actinomycetota bacterium]